MQKNCARHCDTAYWGGGSSTFWGWVTKKSTLYTLLIMLTILDDNSSGQSGCLFRMNLSLLLHVHKLCAHN